MSTYNVEEILKIAINIEQNAVSFYEAAARQEVGEPVRQLMSDLAAWEAQHVNLFSDMLAAWEQPQGFTLDPEDHVAGYLRAIAAGVIFTPEMMERELPGPGDSAAKLIEQALQREQEAIVFFLALRDSISEPEHKQAVEDLVREEMSHVSFLLERKENL